MEEHDLAWLAGIIDGEGYLGVYFTTRNRTQGAHHVKQLVAKLSITNTKPSLIKKVVSILKDMEIKPYIQVDTRTRDNMAFIVIVSGKKFLRKLLPKLVPHLTCKKNEAEGILDLFDYLELRGRSSKYSLEYIFDDPKVLEKVEEIKQMKQKEFVKTSSLDDALA
jgi:hypothetical protein